MDFETYRRSYFKDPEPEPTFPFVGLAGFAIYLPEFDEALRFYTEVLGPPAYREGEHTRGWRLGSAWLTLFPGDGPPAQMEVHIRLSNPAEVDRLHDAFLAAGATGQPPSDEMMYDPVRFGFLTDPFGTNLVLLADR
jgi:catechol 2,3-dioxygenase-like lactoylglutathione lyase family enzyme